MKKTQKTHIIWDLSGTLFRPTDEGLTDQEKKDVSFLMYMWSGKSEPSSLDKLALTILNALDKQYPYKASETILTHTGEPVPSIICSFLAGRISAKEAQHYVQTYFTQWTHQDIDAHDRAQLNRMLKAFFDPRLLARCMKPVPEALSLAQKTSNNPNNKLYILSNWDTESFEFLYNQFQYTVFALFIKDHIVISGKTGFLKPQRGIYQYFLTQYHLDPATCFFIDDQAENIEAAHAFSIEGIQFRASEVHKITDVLRKKNII